MSEGRGRLPDFLVIGAMRSGTSSLARYLRAHPAICFATEKEVHFFDRNFDRGLEWYKRHFPCDHPGHLTGEATQTYMYHGEALDRMVAVVPKARLIVTLRHPVERAYSHFWLNRARGREPLDFRQAIDAEPERIRTGGLNERLWYSYLGRGSYARQLVGVAERYSREQLLVLRFEDLRDAPARTYRRICTFLQIDDGFLPAELGRVVNPYVTFRSLRARDLARRLPGPFRRVVGRLNTRHASYPPMDAALRRELNARFDEEIGSLEMWLGEDLSAWRE